MKKLIRCLPRRCRPVLVTLLLSPLAVAAPVLELTKTVDNGAPIPGEPVEFTIAVVNSGDETAVAVEVQESLPAELVIPTGLAAFPANGSYDPATGLWTVGDLEPGAGSTLVVPAVVNTANPPDCIVNMAGTSYTDEFGPVELAARAAVRKVAGTHCVDLEVTFSVRAGEVFLPECDRHDRYFGVATVTNLGPDAARDVVITISQDPVVGPNLGFQDPDCASASSAQCRIDEVAAGDSVEIDVTSDLFQSHETFTQTISVFAESADLDYDASNDSQSDTGSAGGFSSCEGIDLGDDVFGDLSGIVSPCFIATAAYGSPMHEHIDTLREFRDGFLMQHRYGRAFVAWYYRHSPAVAEYMGTRPWLRTVVRWLLGPIVYAIAYPALMLVLPGMLLALLVRRRHRALQRRNRPLILQSPTQRDQFHESPQTSTTTQAICRRA